MINKMNIIGELLKNIFFQEIMFIFRNVSDIIVELYDYNDTKVEHNNQKNDTKFEHYVYMSQNVMWKKSSFNKCNKKSPMFC